MPILKIKKLTETAVIPKYMTEGAAAMDLTADSMEVIAEGYSMVDGRLVWKPTKYQYGTGLAFEIPKGHVGLLFPRSSIHKVPLILTNGTGVCDSDYRGEVSFMFQAVDRHGEPYAVGERIGQLMIVELSKIEIQEVEELSDTERGSGGFGSTGK